MSLIGTPQYPVLGYQIQAEYHSPVSKTRFTHADETFRELLKELRLAKNLTQTDLATLLKQPQSYVSKYELGERRLDFVETSLVCGALGTSIEDFAKSYSTKVVKAIRAKRG